MYDSRILVDDNKAHHLQFVVNGKNLTMITDYETRQSISNDGTNSLLQINADQHLYVGGVPEALYKKVQESYQIRNATSLKGK